MKLHGWFGVSCVLMLAACSGETSDPVSAPADEGRQQPAAEISQESETVSEEMETVAAECPGFEALFAMLPEQLAGESVGERYLSCDALAPTALAHFTSEDQGTYWTFAVTSLELDVDPARPRWDLAGVDDAQKARLRKGVKAAVDGEALLFDNCVNTLQVAGASEWLVTNRVNTGPHDVCIGTDAQPIEDGGWVGRAKSTQYLYALRIEGDKAVRFSNAQEATAYVEGLFRQFR